MHNLILKNGTEVIIHSFGDGFEVPGVICGIVNDFPQFQTYIVKLSENPWNHPYDCITVPSVCLRTVL